MLNVAAAFLFGIDIQPAVFALQFFIALDSRLQRTETVLELETVLVVFALRGWLVHGGAVVGDVGGDIDPGMSVELAALDEDSEESRGETENLSVNQYV